MTINSRLEKIKVDLAFLKEADPSCELFGARRHKYNFNSPLKESEVESFERRFNIRLPEDYRCFIMNIGNGGAGPYYGLETLENSLFADLDFKRENEFVDPSIPFPITEPWNLEYEGNEDDESEVESFDEQYFDPKWDSGILRICNFGCGVTMNLVVNGAEYGHIWVDDRCNDGGIYPDPYFGQTERTSFLEWYEMWLKRSLNDIHWAVST